MATLSVLTWIGNAAAVLCGSHGDVTAHAQQAGCSRQTAYDHAAKVQQAVADAQLPGPSRATLLDEVRALRQQLDQVSDVSPPRPLDKPAQQRFAVSASAMGLSLNQIEDLLGSLLPPQCGPDRATLGRWVGHASQRAAQVLAVLDRHSRPHAQQLALDEIFFHGTPVLVAVEPASMALLLCQRAGDRSGATWEQALRPFTALEAVVRDAGSGLSAGLALLDEHRRQQGLAPLDDGLDVFHTDREAQRLLGRLWRGVEKHWAAAEEADQRLARAQRQGRDARGPAAVARVAWRKATHAFTWYEHWEGLWRRAKAALAVFRPDGRLNDRAWAEAELAAVCAALRAPYWKKLVSHLQDRRTLAFLDRLHRRLAVVAPQEGLRAALVELWRLEHRCHGATTAEVAGLAVRRVVQRVVCAKATADWEGAYARVAEVMTGVVRASSVVECVNSVLRMPQSRHRNLTQGLLDLKRLYWNSRAFRDGKRKEKSPYEHLGLRLPSYDFWELLHTDPQQLEQQLSTPNWHFAKIAWG
jgi:hypothetical protein